MESKFLKTLGLCRRAGRLTYGFDMVAEALDRTEMIFFAADLSARTRNSVLQLAARHGVESKDLPYDMHLLGAAMGTKPVGVIGITDAGFGRLLGEEIEKQ